jgi:flagella basal body P-ring formation protein FlgA
MNGINRVFATVIALILAQAPGHAVAGEPSALALRPEAKVDGKGVFLSQVLAPSDHAPLPSFRLAAAPAVGQTNTLSRQQIIDMARDSVPALNTTNWSGPEIVRISRRVRQLCEAEVLDMLREAMQRDYVGGRGTLEIHFTRPWQPATVPEEAVTMQITDVPAAGMLPNLMAGFELWCGRERIGSWQAPMRARVWRDIPVAHSPVVRGQLLREADITLERRDTLAQHEECIQFPVADTALEAACDIQAGMPVWSRQSRPRAVLKRGQLVEAVYQDGPMRISLKVEALEDGAPGQMVRVRNPKTSRVLYGKIQNQDLILIAL